jgi:hypothetical protein
MTENDAPTQLTFKQRKAITALLLSRTELDAAQMAGISLRTVVRWLTMPHFRDELRRAGIDASQAIVRATMRRLTEGQRQALDVLEGVMKRGKANEKRLAATSWMAIYRDLKELIDFEERLDRLEKELIP